jgi:hypothetical protein
MNDRSPNRISLSSVAPRCDHSEAHPQTAVLIVAIADRSLGFDGVRKKRAYARNGVAGDWIFDLNGKALEDHRQPSGDDYTETDILDRRGSVVPPPDPDTRYGFAKSFPATGCVRALADGQTPTDRAQKTLTGSLILPGLLGPDIGRPQPR